MNYLSVIVSVMYAVVNYLLLICTGKLLRKSPRHGFCVIGSIFGGMYCFACFCVSFLNCWSAYILVLISVCIISFGFKSGWITSYSVYLMLTISLGGLNIGTRGMVSLLLGSIGVFLVLLIAKRTEVEEFIDVRFVIKNKPLVIRALIDSGNLLSDPISGETVLLVGADVAEDLTGLTPVQLKNPVDNLTAIQGLRLLSYSTISEKGKFLLAKRISNVLIDSRERSVLVAFCPEKLSPNGKFQALVGGHL